MRKMLDLFLVRDRTHHTKFQTNQCYFSRTVVSYGHSRALLELGLLLDSKDAFYTKLCSLIDGSFPCSHRYNHERIYHPLP